MPHADSRWMRLIPRPETIGAGVTVVVILALLPNVLSSYDVFIASTGLIMATILLGLGIVTGRGHNKLKINK